MGVDTECVVDILHGKRVQTLVMSSMTLLTRGLSRFPTELLLLFSFNDFAFSADVAQSVNKTCSD